VFRVQRDPLTGKRKAITGELRDTKTEAEKDRRRLAYEIEQGDHNITPGGTVTVAKFLDYYLEHRSDQLRYNSVIAYERSFRLHIKPYLGNERLMDITPTRLNRWLVNLRQTRPVATVKKTWQYFKTAITQAHRWQFIDKNPCDSIEAPRARTKSRHVLTGDELRRLLAVLASDYPLYYPLFLTLATLGLRIGEAQALRWSDIDGNQLHIQRTVVMRGSAVTFGEPKTRNANRTLTLPPKLHTVLCSLPNHNDYIFVNGDTLLTRFNARHALHHACDSAELPRITPHELRHTVASLWIANNEDLATISAKLGHASINETLKTYAHAFAKRVQTSAYDVEDL